MSPDHRFLNDQFPRSSAYHPEWIVASVGGGANSLWLTEWLASALQLRPGMNVLDLGCGRAASSILLSREYQVKVWATDLWCSASENHQRVRDAGVAESVYPIHADARALPFASDFFDVVVSIDSYFYFGTDDHYLNYLARFVKPGGVIAIASAGLMHEIEGPLPEHLQAWWAGERGMWCLHSAAWWRRHWERTGIVDIELADSMPDGWKLWVDWHHLIAPDNRVEIEAVQSDRGEHLGYVRVVGRRRPNICLDDPAWLVSVPSKYEQKPLLRVGP